MFDCLVDIIGVTQSECECLINGLSDEMKAKLKVSGSKLYMDQIPDSISFNMLNEIDACKDFANITLQSRDEALQFLGDDIALAISNKYKKSSKNYKGSIGKASYNQTLANNRPFQGIRTISERHTDGVMKISRIRIVGTGAGVMSLKISRTIVDNNEYEEMGTYAFTAVNNQYVNVALPDGGLTFELGTELQPYEYRFYYELVDGFHPKNNDLKGNCTGCDDPLKPYITSQGISFLQENTTTFSGDSYAHGIVMDVELSCGTQALLCREYNNSEPITIACNYAALYKANEILNERVLASPEINRYTMQNREYLWGKRNHFRKEYENRVLFVADTIDITASDCFECAPRGMWKGKIKS